MKQILPYLFILMLLLPSPASPHHQVTTIC